MGIIKSLCPIALLVAIPQDESRYRLIQLNPEVRTIIDFNLNEVIEYKLHERDYIGVLTLTRGVRRPIEQRPDEKHYLFEKLGYTPGMNGIYQSISEENSRIRPKFTLTQFPSLVYSF